MISPLLPFSGGLRRQAPFILEVITHYLEKVGAGKVLCDPFFGGGSISFEARLKEYKVFSSDIALRSYVPANCLIRETETLSADALHSYMEKLGDIDISFSHQERVSKVLYEDTIEVLRKLWLHADTPSLKYLALRSLFELVPLGGFGLMKRTEKSKSAVDSWESCRGKIDDLTPVLDKVRGIINSGLSITGDLPVGEVYQRDAREHILDSAAQGANAVHLDPPTYGSKGYINLYWWLDAILEDKVIEEAEGFSRAEALKFVGDCVDCAKDIPVVAITQQEVSYPLQDARSVLSAAGREVFAYEVPLANTSNPFYIVIGVK